MKKTAKALLLILCLFALKMAPAYAEALTVRITQINGTVQVMKGTGAFVAAKAGQKAGKGHVIKTAANSSCILNWSSGHAVKVSAMSVVTVEHAEKNGDTENSRIAVGNGKLYAKVGKLSSVSSEFTIKTPTAIAGVRGSEIMVEATEQSSSFMVLEGSFEVTADSVAYIIDENYQMDIEPGVAPAAPEPIPPQELNEILQETQEIKMEMDASEVELKDLGGELEKIDEEEPLEESGGAESTDTAIDEHTDQVIDDIEEVVDQQTINANIGQFEPGAGGVEIIID